MSAYQVYLPAARTNSVANPSFETTATGWTDWSGAVLSRGYDQSAFGGWSLKVDTLTGSSDQGARYTDLSLAANQVYTGSMYVYGTLGATYALTLYDATNAIPRGTTTFTGTGAWQRVEVTITTGAGTSTYHLIIATASSGTDFFYIDGAQVELQSDGVVTATTYIDGDQPGCIWNGRPHASTSTRSEQWRGGGRIVDLEDYEITVSGTSGVGAAGYTNVSTDNGVIGGATFQRSIVKPRPFALQLWIKSVNQADFHAKRQALIDLLKPNLVSPQQPVVLRYSGNGKGPRVIHCHYESGLESSMNWLMNAPIEARFIANDPYWYAEFQEHKLLPAFDTIPDADYVIERTTSGTYRALAGGLNGSVNTVLYGEDGNLYVGGNFTIAYNSAGTGSPITVNRFAMWDGTAWSALGSGFNDSVTALAQAPDGTIYIGGWFTDAAYPYLAKWDGSTLSPVGGVNPGNGKVNDLRYNAVNGKLYIGGLFTFWYNLADAHGIVAWNGTSYETLSTGTTSDNITNGVHCVALEANGNVLVGGLFTTAGGVSVSNLARWNITTNAWESMGATFNNYVSALLVTRSGLLYAGGAWTTPTDHPYLAVYNGAAWSALGSGVNNQVYRLLEMPDGDIVVAGRFTTAGGSTLNDRTARWNGSAWTTMLLDLPGNAIVFAAAHNRYTNELTFGYDTAGSAISANTVDTEVVNSGTEDTAPLIFINHAGTIEAIINWTTGAAIYFNLQAQPGEWFYLDLSVLTPQHAPTWHASPFGRNGPRLWSTVRGDCTRFILPQSNLTSWRLLPGTNTILVKSRGAAAGSAFLLSWKRRYVSNDA